MESLIIILLILFQHPFLTYPLTLWILKKIRVEESVMFEGSLPSVTLVIVAHNEEKVIEEKIINTLELEYDKEKLEIVVASDHSDDRTNEIVSLYESQGVKLVKTKERLGRANAHNEALNYVNTEIIAYSDANSFWEKNALTELMKSFKNPKVGYVTGQLKYVNTLENSTSYNEGLYWRIELFLRKLESSIKSITAGNGAIYAIRKNLAVKIDILYSHDIAYPCHVVKNGFYSIYNERAIAFEKAGETVQEEFNRKTRMFGRAFYFLKKNLWTLNPFKVGLLYSYFFISHRLLRYFGGLLLFLILIFTALTYRNHLTSILLTISVGLIFLVLTKKLRTLYYFLVFQYATLVGLIKFVSGKIKPYWVSPKTTR